MEIQERDIRIDKRGIKNQERDIHIVFMDNKRGFFAKNIVR
ncbi:hypothetical protein [Arachidicoccus soli]|jgi:hypothetical protein|nr:hypothetical protein [Arachidicoccus soli]